MGRAVEEEVREVENNIHNSRKWSMAEQGPNYPNWKTTLLCNMCYTDKIDFKSSIQKQYLKS